PRRDARRGRRGRGRLSVTVRAPRGGRRAERCARDDPRPRGRRPRARRRRRAHRAHRARRASARAGDGRRRPDARRGRASPAPRSREPRPMRGRAGFTLLEIMVVVFIIGLLATLVAPKVVGRADDARRTKAVADMKGIEQALNLYRLDSGGYPTTEQG